ncbi:MAG TPA: type 2 isopentenyl-diphosphate Delta-isomerase [Anaeromyxobacteraceae bacterium]|nr:type 2 isopentenyl-diphosphate Delta-isomerase [Anaeromyxobacteraceae bacterium]
MAGPSDVGEITKRKGDHLALCATDAVAFKSKGTLLDEVELVHDALPERAVDEVRLETRLLGKVLSAPLVVSGMTGGTAEARAVNRDLARAAEAVGVGFGLGSQRAMLRAPDLGSTYAVRDVAPKALVLGNIGLVQARETPTARLAELVRAVGADALCVHLNPAMELVQPGGDRDFRGGLDTLRRLHGELPVPIVVKETGAGLSRRVAERVAAIGIRAVDVSGAGGTSWVGVETLRAEGRGKALGETFWDWGIPTAASVGLLDGLGLEIIATGGVRSGLDVARALALGATAGGMAAPLLRAQRAGGFEGARRALETVVEEIRVATFLCGCAGSSDLRRAPRVLGPRLAAWLREAR